MESIFMEYKKAKVLVVLTRSAIMGWIGHREALDGIGLERDLRNITKELCLEAKKWPYKTYQPNRPTDDIKLTDREDILVQMFMDSQKVIEAFEGR